MSEHMPKRIAAWPVGDGTAVIKAPSTDEEGRHVTHYLAQVMSATQDNVAIAERIMLCYNAHDDLLGACEQVLECGAPICSSCTLRIRKAIAKAKGEE